MTIIAIINRKYILYIKNLYIALASIINRYTFASLRFYGQIEPLSNIGQINFLRLVLCR